MRIIVPVVVIRLFTEVLFVRLVNLVVGKLLLLVTGWLTVVAVVV